MHLDRLREMYRRYDTWEQDRIDNASAFDVLLGHRKDCNPNRNLTGVWPGQCIQSSGLAEEGPSMGRRR